MLCYEVWVNGERRYLAGHNQMNSLQASLYATKLGGPYYLAVRAEVQSSESLKEDARWPFSPVKVGDEVRIKLLESESADQPEKMVSFGTKFHEGEKILYCSFCGQNQEQAKRLVAGFGANVCSDCFKLLEEIFSEQA
jgi:hypothetical protein